MSEMEDKLGAILSNPQLMQQIQAMAQSLTPSQPEMPKEASSQNSQIGTGFDPGMLQKLTNLARQGNVDQNQQNLLRALSPYLSRERLCKLEKAMRSAKMAQMASLFLNSGGMQLLSGR